MAKKHSRAHGSANVAVPLNGAWFIGKFSELLGGPFSEEIRNTCRTDWAPFERELRPESYSCPDSFKRDYQLGMMLSKFDDGKSSQAKAASALEKFQLAEELCAQTNRNFANFVGGPLQTGLTVEAVLFTAQRKIAKLLGQIDWDVIASGFDFGPGASTRLPRRRADTWYKFQGKPEATTNCADIARVVFQHNRLWKESVLNEHDDGSDGISFVRSNRVVTVPKNAKTDRVIAIEPDLNLFIQKGFGRFFRDRLKKVGIDLNDQTRNQFLAHVGSLDGSLATIDLSMASDTVSRAIVEALLPPDWLQALEQCRSPEGVLPCGRIIRYHKFSSMGNGFTFELESLIFWALCSSVADLTNETDRRISVYGDDIIVPVSIVEPVIGILQFAGFRVNEKKSYWSGPFRESCGKHYFLGVDVTPFYVRSQPKRLSDVFLLHNNVVRWCHHAALGYRDNSTGLRVLCEDLRGRVPANWRKPRIPDGYGDGAFIGSFDECTPRRAKRDFCGWSVEVLCEPRRTQQKGGVPSLLKGLWSLERRGSATVCGHRLGRQLGLHQSNLDRRIAGLFVSQLRDENPFVGSRGASAERVPLDVRARVIKTLVPQWAELGPWF